METLNLALACAAFIAFNGCSRPLTDIVATNTEEVGEYVVTATATGDRLQARVCLAAGADADAVGERVVRQLINHGYRLITLDLVEPRSHGGSATRRLTWTREQGARTGSSTPADQNPCGGSSPHGTSS